MKLSQVSLLWLAAAKEQNITDHRRGSSERLEAQQMPQRGARVFPCEWDQRWHVVLWKKSQLEPVGRDTEGHRGTQRDTGGHRGLDESSASTFEEQRKVLS